MVSCFSIVLLAMAWFVSFTVSLLFNSVVMSALYFEYMLLYFVILFVLLFCLCFYFSVF